MDEAEDEDEDEDAGLLDIIEGAAGDMDINVGVEEFDDDALDEVGTTAGFVDFC